jgi:hypothetical protein
MLVLSLYIGIQSVIIFLIGYSPLFNYEQMIMCTESGFFRTEIRTNSSAISALLIRMHQAVLDSF